MRDPTTIDPATIDPTKRDGDAPSAPTIRLHVEAELGPGAVIRPDPRQSHYLLVVMRRRSGDPVSLFNGRDGEWQATLVPEGRRGCRLETVVQRRVQADEPGPALLFAPLKRGPQEWLIEKATELGAAVLIPVITRRGVVPRINPGRLAAIAGEAAEQCRRLSVPPITHPIALEDVVAERPAGTPLYFADESGAGQSAFAAMRAAGVGDLLIGPEGGFAPEERAWLVGRPEVVAIDLGPRILRAETAALAALTLWQAALGES